MKFNVTDIIWTVGLFLLLTFAFWLMVFLPFNWKISAVIAGAIVALGVAAMIYITIKSPED